MEIQYKVKMKIELYNNDKHYDLLKKWYEDHEQKMLDKSLIPGIGLVVDNCVAGFLYQTDSKLAIIENYISDKNSTKEQRHNAIIALTNGLYEVAHQLGYRTILSFTNNSGLLDKQDKLSYKIVAKDMNVLMRSF